MGMPPTRLATGHVIEVIDASYGKWDMMFSLDESQIAARILNARKINETPIIHVKTSPLANQLQNHI
jgi:hypothetical protein